MVQGTQTIATFTGTLLKREHGVGQKFVQLVFRENDKNWLCVSTDPTTARLNVGQRYHIRGLFKHLGERPYIHEPTIVLARGKFTAVGRWSLYTIIVLLIAGATALAVRLVHGSLAPTSAETTQHERSTTKQDTSPTAAPGAATEAPAAQTPPPAPPVTKPKTTTKKPAAPAAATPTPVPTPTTVPKPSTPPPTDTTPPPDSDVPVQDTPPANTPTDPPADPPATPSAEPTVP